MSGVPYIFANATTSIPLNQLDTNFATPVTIGNTTVALGNTVTILNGLANVGANVVGSTANVSFSIQSNATTAITVDTSQNVGIGTSSFSFASAGRGILEINGASDIAVIGLKQANTSYGYLSAGTGVMNVVASAVPMQIQSTGANYIASFTNGVERMRIDSSGNLLVGTTSAATTTRFASYQSTAGAYCAQYKSTKDGSNNSYFNAFYNDAGSLVGYIVTANQTGTNYTSVSDYRLKENVAPMTGALSKVAQLKPVTYKWKESGTDGQGFIAHELQEVCPDAVTGAKDAVDAEGNPVYQGIDTSFLVATLTAAIQELNATITDLQAKLKSAGVAGF